MIPILDHPTSAHLWEEDRQVVNWLEGQVVEGTRCTVQDSIKLIKKEALLNNMKDVSSELAEDVIMFMAEKLSPAKRAEITKAVAELGEVRGESGPHWS